MFTKKNSSGKIKNEKNGRPPEVTNLIFSDFCWHTRKVCFFDYLNNNNNNIKINNSDNITTL